MVLFFPHDFCKVPPTVVRRLFLNLVDQASGILPDFMHLVHLALFPDAITSALLDWTDNQWYVEGGSRDKRLAKLWENYRAYCEEAHITERAQRKLFTTAVLKPEGGRYCELSQKILNATGARYMTFWASSLSVQFATLGYDADMFLGSRPAQSAGSFCRFGPLRLVDGIGWDRCILFIAHPRYFPACYINDFVDSFSSLFFRLLSTWASRFRFRAGVFTGLAEMELCNLHGGRYFSTSEWETWKVGYFAYRSGCMHLANAAIEAKQPRWRQRPKSHQLEHLGLDWRGLNPRYCSNYLDEDFVRRAKKVALASNPRFVSKHVLFRYTVDSTLRWMGPDLF